MRVYSPLLYLLGSARIVPEGEGWSVRFRSAPLNSCSSFCSGATHQQFCVLFHPAPLRNNALHTFCGGGGGGEGGPGGGGGGPCSGLIPSEIPRACRKRTGKNGEPKALRAIEACRPSELPLCVFSPHPSLSAGHPMIPFFFFSPGHRVFAKGKKNIPLAGRSKHQARLLAERNPSFGARRL